MYGVLANTLTIVIGSAIGLIFKKYIPKSLGDTIMKVLGLCVLYIGISGALKGENTLILIVSIVLGTTLGTLLKLEDRLNGFANKMQGKFSENSSADNSFAQGFVSSTLLFCVGAMAVVGSLQAGLTGDNQMLYTKSALDGVSSVVFASAFGAGTFFSAIVVFLYQGTITLLSGFLSPLLSEACINEMTCAGSVLIMGIGLNMLGITKLKIMDYLPAVFIPAAIFLFI